MGTRTGLDADQARRPAGKDLEHLPAPDLVSDQYLSGRADAVHLEDGLGDIEADGGDRAHGLLLCRWLLEAAMLPHRWVGAVHSINSGHAESRRQPVLASSNVRSVSERSSLA